MSDVSSVGQAVGHDKANLQSLLFTISCCENIPISLVHFDTEQRKKPEIVTSSFTSPVVEMLRASPKFRQREAKAIEVGLRTISRMHKRMPTKIDMPECLDTNFQAMVAPTKDEGTFLYFGPMLSSRDSSHQEDLSSDMLDALSEDLAGEYQSDRLTHQISSTRLRRFLLHRAPVMWSDVTVRARRAVKVFERFLILEDEFAKVTAEETETAGKTACFLEQVTLAADGDLSFSLGSTAVGSEETIEGRPRIVAKFDHDRDRYAYSIRFTDNTKPESRESFRSDVIERRWSQFNDYYRACRNSFFLEQLLLLRLWLQDEFDGLSIKSDTGRERMSVFHVLAEKIRDIAAADGAIIYKYQHGDSADQEAAIDDPKGYLTRIGWSYANGLLGDSSADEARNIELIAADPVARLKSQVYRAVDTGETAFLRNATRADIAFKGLGFPKSIIVVPLISRGRIWGAMEVLGQNSGQFLHMAVRWAEEIVRVITPFFYGQWLLYHLREISRLSDSIQGADDKYTLVLDHVRRIFLASSARLFLQNSRRTSLYEIRSHAGPEWPEGSAEQFDLTNSDSVSVQCIESGDLWVTGRLGEEPFTEKVEGEGDVSTLEGKGHRACAVIPIRDSRGNCFASILLTSADDDQYSSDWDMLVETVTEHLSVVFEAIHLQETEVEERNEYFAHTIKTRVERVAEGGENLIRILEPLLGNPELRAEVRKFAGEVETISSLNVQSRRPTLSNSSRAFLQVLQNTLLPHSTDDRAVSGLPEALLDLKKHLDEVKKSAVRIAGGVNAEHPLDAMPEDWKGTPAQIRGCWQESIQPRRLHKSLAGTAHTPEMSVLSWSHKVQMPAQILIEIFNNILDNAIKYDFSPPSITVRFSIKNDHGAEVVVLSVRNLAPHMSEAEAELVSRGRQRSQFAKDRDRYGSGIGLKYNLEKCREWGLKMEYTIPTLEHGPEQTPARLGWHEVRLEIPTLERG